MANTASPPAENVWACERNRTAWITAGHTMPRLSAPDASGKLRKSTVLPNLKFHRRIKFRMVKVASYVNFAFREWSRETFSGEFGERQFGSLCGCSLRPGNLLGLLSRFTKIRSWEQTMLSRDSNDIEYLELCKKVEKLVKLMIGIRGQKFIRTCKTEDNVSAWW